MKKAIGNPHTEINLVHTIFDMAMHIFYNSELENTTLWSKNGFAAGYGIGCEKKRPYTLLLLCVGLIWYPTYRAPAI